MSSNSVEAEILEPVPAQANGNDNEADNEVSSVTRRPWFRLSVAVVGIAILLALYVPSGMRPTAYTGTGVFWGDNAMNLRPDAWNLNRMQSAFYWLPQWFWRRLRRWRAVRQSQLLKSDLLRNARLSEEGDSYVLRIPKDKVATTFESLQRSFVDDIFSGAGGEYLQNRWLASDCWSDPGCFFRDRGRRTPAWGRFNRIFGRRRHKIRLGRIFGCRRHCCRRHRHHPLYRYHLSG